MGDEEFIGYCESHCDTPRAGFIPQNIVRILRLAGDDTLADLWAKEHPHRIVSIGPEAMLPICEKARARLQDPTHDK